MHGFVPKLYPSCLCKEKDESPLQNTQSFYCVETHIAWHQFVSWNQGP